MYDINIFYTPAGGEAQEITGIVEEFEISEQDGSRTAEASFTLSDLEGQYLRAPRAAAGDIITVKSEGEVLYIFSVEKAERNWPKRKVSCRDFGLFLENNDIVIQFNGESVKECCEKVFAKVGVSEYELPEMGASITEVYYDSCEDILADLFSQQELADGKEYSYRVIGEKVNVFVIGSENERIEMRHKPARNVAEYGAGEHHGIGSYSHDISDMHNAVRAVVKNTSDSESLPTEEYLIEDSDLISKYGRREKLLNVSSSKADEIETLAAAELKSEAEIKRTLKADFAGVLEARRGKIFEFTDEYLGLSGTAVILSAEHSFSGGVYTMTLELKML